jgi:glyceraldehyde 3-phosphate dehydrogenase
MTKVAINGMGRIGRAALKIIRDTPDLELVAINDLMALDNLVYLLKYDTVYGRYERPVGIHEGNLVVDGEEYKFLSERDPAQLPWKELDIAIVFECTGLFTREADLEKTFVGRGQAGDSFRALKGRRQCPHGGQPGECRRPGM